MGQLIDRSAQKGKRRTASGLTAWQSSYQFPLPFVLQCGLALVELSARDAKVHRLDAQVRQLMNPPSALMEPELMQQVMAVMAE
jgi:hypothetical protein